MVHRRAPAVLVSLAALCWASCAPQRFLPPLSELPLDQVGDIGPGGIDEFEEATRPCHNVFTVTGALDISGVIGGARVAIRLSYGIAMGLGMRLESMDTSRETSFVFSATREKGTMYLPASNTVFSSGSPTDILTASFGLPLDARTWERLLGCPRARNIGYANTERLGTEWQVVRADSEDGGFAAYLRLRPPRDAWDLVALMGRMNGNQPSWRADFTEQRNGTWRTVRLTGMDWVGRPGHQFDLVFRIEPIQINGMTGTDIGAIPVPPTAREITLDELRKFRPLVDP